MNDELLTIGAFAAATGLTIAALRHYDEIGLLKPAQVDPGTGYRRYRPDQVGDARLICGLRGVGVPVEEVRAMVGRPGGEVRTALDAHRERLLVQLRELSQRIAAVGELIDKGTPMPELQAVRPVQIRLRVADVKEAAAFYTAAFDVVFNESISSLQFGAYRSDLFFLITLEESDRGPAHFGLLVQDVDAAYGRALDAGAAEVHPPTDFPWKPRTACVSDPDGNLIDLSQG